MGGLSIAATVLESEVRDEDNPTFFHFVITKAIVDEISLSPIPANPRPACMIFAMCQNDGHHIWPERSQSSDNLAD